MSHMYEYTHAAMADVLLFQNYLIQKQTGPSSIPEGDQALYTVRLDGPPPNDVEVAVNDIDNFIRL